ncbi:hypothetical protein JCM19045_2516 [Bacillus sp. JCM 19045]|uniref:Membrane protein n=1 Tax=Shouchella xiaoxiensis TaxID=766895 RepID=A0ABS2SPD4_9BACI|nr:DUF2273 domain-containing protein [Shouchella xiaoxiensis]MBM7837378.1 putative membrane protein [Shouchella xiaoxiensis]GAF13279.1 hypothetical protein JCM19045_2516 [Bacillus sp. JCM 19045]
MDREKQETFKRYRGRILGLVIAAVFSILFLTIGFGYTVVIAIFVTIGFLVGKWIDGDLNVSSYLEAMFGKRQ